MFALNNHLFSTAKEKEDHQDWLTVHCKTDHRYFILVKTDPGGGRDTTRQSRLSGTLKLVKKHSPPPVFVVGHANRPKALSPNDGSKRRRRQRRISHNPLLSTAQRDRSRNCKQDCWPPPGGKSFLNAPSSWRSGWKFASGTQSNFLDRLEALRAY